MKRILLIPVLSALFWSCSKTDDLINEGGGVNEAAPIAINVDSESLTRGTPVDSERTMASVGLYCAYTAQGDWSTGAVFNRMDNCEFHYNTSTLEWDFKRQTTESQPVWDFASQTDKYTFYAYSPHSTEASGIVPKDVYGALQIDYTVPANYASQKDLMVATPRKNIYPQASGKVNLEFKHVLSKVGFTVKVAEGVSLSSELIIKSVEVNNAYSKGVLSFASNDSYSWALSGSNNANFTATAPSGTKLTDEVSVLGDNYMFMLPQSVATTKQQFELNYTLGGADKSIVFDMPCDLEKGKGYNFIFTIDPSFKCELTYTIAGWTDHELEEDIDGTEFRFLDNTTTYSFSGTNMTSDNKFKINIPFECSRDDINITVSSTLGKGTAQIITNSNSKYIEYIAKESYKCDADELVVTVAYNDGTTTKYNVHIEEAVIPLP